MKKYIQNLMESLFDDDDIFDDEFNDQSDILIGRDVEKILDKLMNGFTVSDDDLELVCTPQFQYKVADYTELHSLIYGKIKPQLFKDDIHEFNLNWIDMRNVKKLDYLLQFKPQMGDKYPIFWHVENWNTAHVTRMKQVFGNQKQICDLSKWNTANVCTMEDMFVDCEEYDGNNGISNWDVHNVEFFIGMFDTCKKFNGDITKWNTENAIDMTDMFNDCEVFNWDISNWNVSKVEHMDNMFSLCKKFNQPIQKWNLVKCKTFKNMLFQCGSFDQDFSCIDLRKYNIDNIAFFDKGTPMSNKGNSGRILNTWDFLKLGYERGTLTFDVGEFDYGYGDPNGNYAKIYNVIIDDGIQDLNNNDYYFPLEDVIYLDGQDSDTYDNDDCINIDVLTFKEFELLYEVCDDVTMNDTNKKGENYPDIKLLIKNKVINDFYYTDNLIIDKSNINYYINRELLSLDIKKDEFNSYTGWTLDEFIKFLYTVPSEIKKYKMKYS